MFASPRFILSVFSAMDRRISATSISSLVLSVSFLLTLMQDSARIRRLSASSFSSRRHGFFTVVLSLGALRLLFIWRIYIML